MLSSSTACVIQIDQPTFRDMPPPAAFVPKEPDGIGVHKPVHPFAATVEAQVPVGPPIYTQVVS
jgi:hypothetical protein